MQQTVNKTANTRRERGDFDKLSQEILDKGGICTERKICEYCSAEITLGNYVRWHGENCKMNPNITEEQLKKREPANKGKKSQSPYKPNEKLKGFITAYDLVNKINIRVTSAEFNSNDDLVGMGAKGTPSYKVKDVSIETREKLSKANKGRIVKESTRKLMAKSASERKGLYIWVNNQITNEKSKILKESQEDFLAKNTDWVIGKGKNKIKKDNNAR